MLPRRSVIVTRAAAGGFGLVLGLSLLSGVSELTAAFRGLAAALICYIAAAWLYGMVADSFDQAVTNADVVTNTDAAPAAPAPVTQGASR